MLRYIARRLLQTVPTVLGITLLVFLLFRSVADPAEAILGLHGSPAQKEELRRTLGLYDPLPVQYGRFLGQMATGNLSDSWYLKQPVADEIRSRFPHTVELTVAAMLITAAAGITAGVLAAVRRQTWIDYTAMVTSLVAVSMPVFWLGLVAISILAVKWHWFPLNGRMDPVLLASATFPSGFYIGHSLLAGQWQHLADLLRHLVLPALVLAAASTALVARLTRSTMLEVIRQDFIRTARAKGLGERTVIFRHALKNSLIPVVTVLGLQFGSLLGGAVLTETVFSWPGIGHLTLQAVGNGDLPLIQGIVIVVATTFVLINLVVDLAYLVLDPRIRYS